MQSNDAGGGFGCAQGIGLQARRFGLRDDALSNVAVLALRLDDCRQAERQTQQQDFLADRLQLGLRLLVLSVPFAARSRTAASLAEGPSP